MDSNHDAQENLPENRESYPHSNFPNPHLDKWLEVQEKDLVLRTQELERDKQRDTYTYQSAKESMAHIAEDLKDHRQHTREITKIRLRFLMITVFTLAVFLGFSLYLDKDEIALEIVKAILFIGAGGIGGFALGKNFSKPSEQTQLDSGEES